MLGDAGEFFRDFLRRQNEVNITGGDRVARHAVVLRRLILSKSDSPFALDGLQPERSVSRSPRQNHANRLMSLICRKRFEESINRAVLLVCLLARQQL